MATTKKPQVPAGTGSPVADKSAWQESYRATAEALEQIRTRDLAAMTDEVARRIMHTLCTCETPWRERSDWSGLVEQQAIFRRRRKP